jgi:RecJ-like exonuclease
MSTTPKKRPQSVHTEVKEEQMLAEAEQLSALATKLLGIANDLRYQVLQSRKIRLRTSLDAFPGQSVN